MPSYFILLSGEEKKWNSFLTPFEEFIFKKHKNNVKSLPVKFKFIDSGKSEEPEQFTIPLRSQELVDYANILLPITKLISISVKEEQEEEEKRQIPLLHFIWKPVMSEKLFEDLFVNNLERAKSPLLVTALTQIQNSISSILLAPQQSSYDVLLCNSNQGWLTLQSRRATENFISTNKKPSTTTKTFLIKSDASCVIKGSHSMLHVKMKWSEEEEDEENIAIAKIQQRLSNSCSSCNSPPLPWVIQPTNFIPEKKQFMIKCFCVSGEQARTFSLFCSVYHNNLPAPIDISQELKELEWLHSKTFFKKCPQFSNETSSKYPCCSMFSDSSLRKESSSSLCSDCNYLLFENEQIRNEIVKVMKKIHSEMKLNLFGVDFVVSLNEDDEKLEQVQVVDVNAFPDYSGIHPVELIFERILGF
jgi:hypothetical protein